jgi:hypothetical protein
MRTPNIEIVAAPGVRRSLTVPGDIRTDIDFQNDINNLLARIENLPLPWKPAARMMSYDLATRQVAQRRRNTVTLPLRDLDEGVMESPVGAAQSAEQSLQADSTARIRRGA